MNGQEEKSYIRLPWYGIPRLMPYIRPYGKIILAMVTLGCISSLIDTVFPLFNRYALDTFVYGRDLGRAPLLR